MEDKRNVHKKRKGGDSVMHGGCVGPRMHTQTKGSLLYTVFLSTNALPRASKRHLPVLTRMLYMEGGGKKDEGKAAQICL